MWLVSYVTIAGLALVWTFATPMPSGGDEPAQSIKAAAVARGQLIGTHPKGWPQATALVVVPASVGDLGAVAPCHYGNPALPSHSCHLPSPRHGLVGASTYVAYYPPTYYAVVGIPAALSQQHWALLLMRVVSVLLAGLFLSLALTMAATWSASRWLVVGVAACITPVTIYTASVVNPSGLEIATAIAAWTAGTILVVGRRPPLPGLLAAFLLSSAVMVFSRPLAFLWFPVIVVMLVLMEPRSCRSLWRDRRVKAVGLVAALAAVGAALFAEIEHSFVVQHFPLPRSATTSAIANRLFHLIPTWITEFVGQFGSPNFGGPKLSVVLWLVGASALLVLGLVSAARLQALFLFLYALGAVAVFPFVAQFTHARLQGFGWQGRYNLPLAVGVPILAAALVGRRHGFGVRERSAMVGIWVVAQASSLYFVFCRYTVGLASLFHPFRSVADPWQPPMGRPATLVVGAVAIGATGVWLWVCTRNPLRHGARAEPRPTDSILVTGAERGL